MFQLKTSVSSVINTPVDLTPPVETIFPTESFPPGRIIIYSLTGFSGKRLVFASKNKMRIFLFYFPTPGNVQFRIKFCIIRTKNIPIYFISALNKFIIIHNVNPAIVNIQYYNLIIYSPIFIQIHI